MIEAGGSLTINNDNGEGSHEAYVFLRLHQRDNGRPYDRTTKPEFITRHPICVNVQGDVLYLELFNLGNMASDLITVDYQIIFCTLPSHTLDDAFSASHAQELQSSSVDRIANASYVEANSFAHISIMMPPRPPGLANIYFRARASTLWDAPTKMDDWDFASDPKVTEFHLRVAP